MTAKKLATLAKSMNEVVSLKNTTEMLESSIKFIDNLPVFEAKMIIDELEKNIKIAQDAINEKIESLKEQ